MAPAKEVRGLSCDESFRSAAGKVLWTRFNEMMSYADVALAGEDIEGVHDMRVGSRRLRAALELFREVFAGKQYRPMVAGVKRLADALGEVRDLDVLIVRLRRDMKGRPASQRLVLKEMIAEADQRRDDCRAALVRIVFALEEDDFPRRFMAFVSKGTT